MFTAYGVRAPTQHGRRFCVAVIDSAAMRCRSEHNCNRSARSASPTGYLGQLTAVDGSTERQAAFCGSAPLYLKIKRGFTVISGIAILSFINSYITDCHSAQTHLDYGPDIPRLPLGNSIPLYF